jgi:hypothetical protein
VSTSREDLARIPGGPRDGTTVILYMTDELEMEAVLASIRFRTALPVPATTKYAPRPQGEKRPATPS